jgi:HEAT repeats
VTPAESLRFLDSFIAMEKGERLTMNARQSLATASVRAIALHRDAGADVILDRVATNERETNLRQQALSSLGRLRGAHGFATLRALLAEERAPEMRRRLVAAIGDTREPGTVAALRALLRDPEAAVRAEAVYYFAVRGGAAVVQDVRAIVEGDAEMNVRTRAVSGLARLPESAAVPVLIDLVTTSRHLDVRKKATSALGQSKDARAAAFLQGLLK